FLFCILRHDKHKMYIAIIFDNLRNSLYNIIQSFCNSWSSKEQHYLFTCKMILFSQTSIVFHRFPVLIINCIVDRQKLFVSDAIHYPEIILRIVRYTKILIELQPAEDDVLKSYRKPSHKSPQKAISKFSIYLMNMQHYRQSCHLVQDTCRYRSHECSRVHQVYMRRTDKLFSFPESISHKIESIMSYPIDHAVFCILLGLCKRLIITACNDAYSMSFGKHAFDDL